MRIPNAEKTVRSTLVAAAVARLGGAFASGDAEQRREAMDMLAAIGAAACLGPAIAVVQQWAAAETRHSEPQRQEWLADALCALLSRAPAAEVAGNAGGVVEHLAFARHRDWARPDRSLALRLTGRARDGPSEEEQRVAAAWARVVGALCPARLQHLERALPQTVRGLPAGEAAARVSALRCLRLDLAEPESVDFLRTLLGFRARRNAVKIAVYLTLADIATRSAPASGVASAGWARFVDDAIPTLREDAKKDKYRVAALAALAALACSTSPPAPHATLARELVICAGRTAGPAALAALRTLTACVLRRHRSEREATSELMAGPDELVRLLQTNLFSHNTALGQLQQRGQPRGAVVERLVAVLEEVARRRPDAAVTDLLLQLPAAEAAPQLHTFFAAVPAVVRAVVLHYPEAEACAGLAPLTRPCGHVGRSSSPSDQVEAGEGAVLLRGVARALAQALETLFDGDDDDVDADVLGAALEAIQSLAPARMSVGDLTRQLLRFTPASLPALELVARACPCEAIAEVCQHAADAPAAMAPPLLRIVEAAVGMRRRGLDACSAYADEIEVVALQLLCDAAGDVRRAGVQLLDWARDIRGVDGSPLSLMDIADGVEESLGPVEGGLLAQLAPREDCATAWGNLLGLLAGTAADACPEVTARAWRAVCVRWRALRAAVAAEAEAVQRHQTEQGEPIEVDAARLQLWRNLSVVACAAAAGCPAEVHAVVEQLFALLRGHEPRLEDVALHVAAGPSPAHRDVSVQALSHVHSSAQTVVLGVVGSGSGSGGGHEEEDDDDSSHVVVGAAARLLSAVSDKLVVMRVRGAAKRARWLERCTAAAIFRAVAHRVAEDEWAGDECLRERVMLFTHALHVRALDATREELGWGDLRVELCMLVTSLARLHPQLGREWRVALFRDLRRWADEALELVRHTPPPAAVLELAEPVTGDPPPSLLREAQRAMEALLCSAPVLAAHGEEVLQWLDGVVLGPAVGRTLDCRRLLVRLLADNADALLCPAVERTLRAGGPLAHFYAAGLADAAPVVAPFPPLAVPGAIHAALVYAGDPAVAQLGEVLLGSPQVTSAALAQRYPEAVIAVLQLLFSDAEGQHEELVRRKLECAEQWLAGARLRDAESRRLLEFMYTSPASTTALWGTLAATEGNVAAVVHYVLTQGASDDGDARILAAVARAAPDWTLAALAAHLSPAGSTCDLGCGPGDPRVASRAAALAADVVRAGGDVRPVAAALLLPATVQYATAGCARCGDTLTQLVAALGSSSTVTVGSLVPTVLLLMDAVEHEPGVVAEWGRLAVEWVVATAEAAPAFARGALLVVRTLRPAYSYRASQALSQVVQALMARGDKELLPELLHALRCLTESDTKLLLSPHLVWLAVALTHEPNVALSAPALDLLHAWLRHPTAREPLALDLLEATQPDWSAVAGLSAHLQPAALSGLCDAATQATAVQLLVLLGGLGADRGALVDPSPGRAALNAVGLLPWVYHGLGAGLDVAGAAALVGWGGGASPDKMLAAVVPGLAAQLHETGRDFAALRLMLGILQGGSAWSLRPAARVLAALIGALKERRDDLAGLADLDEWQGITRLLDTEMWAEGVAVMGLVSGSSPSGGGGRRVSSGGGGRRVSSSSAGGGGGGGGGGRKKKKGHRRRLGKENLRKVPSFKRKLASSVQLPMTSEAAASGGPPEAGGPPLAQRQDV